MEEVESMLERYKKSLQSTIEVPKIKAETINLVKQLESRTEFGAQEIVDIIYVIISKFLSAGCPPNDRQDVLNFFIREEIITSFILRLARQSRDLGLIHVMQSLLKITSDDTNMQARLSLWDPLPWFTSLMKGWFVDKQNCNSYPGFVANVLGIIKNTNQRNTSLGPIFGQPIDRTEAEANLRLLIDWAISSETAESLNEVDRQGLTSLHLAALHCFPSVVKILLGQDHINISAGDLSGRTILHLSLLHINNTPEFIDVVLIILSHEDVDVSSPDKNNVTPLTMCINHFLTSRPAGLDIGVKLKFPEKWYVLLKKILNHRAMKSGDVKLGFLNLVNLTPSPEFAPAYDEIMSMLISSPNFSLESCDEFKNLSAMDICLEQYNLVDLNLIAIDSLLRTTSALSAHASASTDMLTAAFLKVCILQSSNQSRQSLVRNVLNAIISNPNFDVNKTTNSSGYTVAHFCAEQKLLSPLEDICYLHNYNPNVKDAVGNTAIFYICSNFEPYVVKKFLSEIQWDFSLKNSVEQNVLDYYCKLRKIDPVVEKLLVEKTPGKVDISASPSIAHKLANLRERQFGLVPFSAYAISSDSQVTPSLPDFVKSKNTLINDDKIYDMKSAAKGKVLIISIPKFEVDDKWLCSLPAYREDCRKITDVMTKIGFEVLVPQFPPGLDDYCMTAREIEKGVNLFAKTLTKEDRCAVLVILSHGGDGFVYGSDGRKAELEPILHQLDNVNCVTMAGKPKICIVQACQGDACDKGMYVRAGPSQTTSPTPIGRHLPTISDMLICLPAMQGYTSFTQRSEGSVFIKHLIKLLAAHADKEDIFTILTWTNRLVSEEVIHHQGTDNKQMSHFDSSLTKLLYFMPNVGGRDGENWQ